MNVLVVYYSRSGITRRVAQELASLMDADIEEIIDPTDRSGTIGYIRSVWHVIRNKEAPIRTPQNDPSTYDLVIVGTPVWGRKMSAPVRAYISQMRMLLPSVAYFCTMKGTGDTSTLEGMAQHAGKTPLAQITFSEQDVKKGTHASELEALRTCSRVSPDIAVIS